MEPEINLNSNSDNGYKSLETFLADHFSHLSLEEREHAKEGIYGTEDVIDETPSFLRDKLSQLQEELAKIDPKPAYDLAIDQNREYVESRELRLKFLRADNFDAKKGATRLVCFMENMLELFGQEVLGRPLAYSDLDNEDHKALRSGELQLLPSRDRSGRIVCCSFIDMFPRKYKQGLAMTKALTYMLMKMVDDDDTQRKGLVVVKYQMRSESVNADPQLMRYAPKIARCIPCKVAAIHLCMEDSLMENMVMRVLLAACGPLFMSRTCIHAGTILEMEYELMKLGIPVESLPLTSQLELKCNNHIRWIAKQKLKDDFYKLSHEKGHSSSAMQKFNRTDIPGCDDVLAGKGKPFQQHSGNLRYRLLIELGLERYMRIEGRSEKGQIVEGVIARVRERGGRFLKKDKDDWWVEMLETEVRQRTVKAFSMAQMNENAKSLKKSLNRISRPPGEVDEGQANGTKRSRIDLGPGIMNREDSCGRCLH